MPGRPTPDFFRLSASFSNSAFRGEASPEGYSVMMKASRGEVRPNRPVVVKHSMGGVFRDFIWVSLEPVVHERVVESLISEGCTGWATYPVEVFDRKGKLAPGYHGFAITGRCQSMFLDKEHSSVVYQEYPGGRFPRYKGLFVTTNSWDGSDFFVSADGNTRFILVTRRVVDVMRRTRVTNVQFEPISDVHVHAPDQPGFPKPRTASKRDSPPNEPLVELPLTAEVQQELIQLSAAGRSRLGGRDDFGAGEIVRLIAAYVDQVRPLEGEDLIVQALEIGCFWAQQIVSAAGWTWVELQAPDSDSSYAIVSPDRSLAIFPTACFHGMLKGWERPNNVILLFNMVRGGNLPVANAGSFLLIE